MKASPGSELEQRSPSSAPPSISCVIPALDEAGSIDQLHAELKRVCREQDLTHQIVIVDDGSTDGTWKAVTGLVEHDAHTEGIRLRRNFGKAAALSAGVSASRGEVVITLDGDLQDDPKEIPRFLAELCQGFDVVSGWKKVRHDPWHKTFPSRIFNSLVSRMTGVKLHDHNCGFKAYRREIFDEIELYGELHRFVPVLAAARGWRIGEIEVQHHARRYGKSKYGLSRLVKGFLDLVTVYLLTGFSSRPQHLIGGIGMFFFLGGAAGMVYLTAAWVVSRLSTQLADVHLHETAIFYYCITFLLLGAQFLLAGLLSELIVARTIDSHRSYSVAEHLRPSEGGTVADA